jgi:hypothetical protein
MSNINGALVMANVHDWLTHFYQAGSFAKDLSNDLLGLPLVQA